MEAKKPGHILITGTGRCGTTFLIALYTFLDFETGYPQNDSALRKLYLYANCGSGMERAWGCKERILKNPTFLQDISTWYGRPNGPAPNIQHVIIPIRDAKAVANSRASHGFGAGGYWGGARNATGQLRFHNTLLADYLHTMVTHDVPTIFLDFDRMVTSAEYLREKLRPTWEAERTIDAETFARAWTRASGLQQKQQVPTTIRGYGGRRLIMPSSERQSRAGRWRRDK